MQTLLSVIVPVFNRPGELEALLRSFTLQDADITYEIIVVDDGSRDKPDAVIDTYKTSLPLKYFSQANSGPGLARNKGAGHASGTWLLFLDSDCELPEKYLHHVQDVIRNSGNIELMGGPDMDRDDFTPTQKAINYTMTSFLTTGGIRGNKRALDTYYPRSFNMLIKKQAFDEAGGFTDLRFGEDLDLSMRVLKQGAKSAYQPVLGVYHRRRTSLRAFFKQVFNSGMARIILNKRHPGTLKWVHLLPALFVIMLAILPLLVIIQPAFLYFAISALFALLLHAYVSTERIFTALICIPASIVQLTGYGLGLMYSWLVFSLLGKPAEYAFKNSFYD